MSDNSRSHSSLPPDTGRLTHAQEQIWVGQRLEPDSPLYNMAFAFVLPTRIDVEHFREAWRRVVAASDALRTRLVELPDGGTEWTLLDRGPETLELDLSQQSDPLREFKKWCRDRCRRPLPLAGDLIDSVLVHLGPKQTGWYLNQHHLLTDAWALQLLWREVSLEYEALLSGHTSNRRPLPSYYHTAAALVQGQTGREEALGFWARQKERPGRLLPLYGRIGSPAGTTSHRFTLEIGEERSRALENLARHDGFRCALEEMSRFSLFGTLLASWLHRVTGSTDLGFDSPVSGRPTQKAKRTIGLFIEMFPFALSVEPSDSFLSLGARCLAETMQFFRHAIPGTSSPSSSAASNVVLNYFPSAFDSFAGLPIEADWVHPGHGDGVHALRLQVHDFSGSGRYLLHFDGNETVLPERLWRRGIEHFDRLLDACLEDPGRRISSVDLLVEEERRVLTDLNSTTAAPLPERSVVEMFESQAGITPERIALRQGGVELSFEELRLRSEALAATLVARGLEPEDRVVVLSRRSTSAVIAILAALRARTAYIPVEPALPPARLQHIVQDSGARLVLLGEGTELAAAPGGVPMLTVTEGIEESPASSFTIQRPGLHDLAYLVYTSGSTGQPKGVLVEHAGLADYLNWASRTYVRGDHFVYPLFSSLAFDLTVTSLFLPLITGGTMEIYPEPDGPVDTALMDLAAANAVDFIKLTPSHLALLVRLGLDGSRIRRMVVGGENLATYLAATASQQLHGQVEIYNEYGPTEAIVGCIAHRFDPVSDTGASVPIGVPADHVEIEILNEALSPVPEGVPGELWISRFGLARGYQGLPDLTAERFPPRPTAPTERRYQTGDQVRIVESGQLEFLGRLDRQIKVSGYRVEPAEIEAALSSLPTVEACAVIEHRRTVANLAVQEDIRHCRRCGLPSDHPKAALDGQGICSVCLSYEAIKDHAADYFGTPDDLRRIFRESERSLDAEFDCLMLLSGGKDSTYALCQLVEMGLSVYAFTLDNGFISENAKKNIRRVTEALGVPVEFATTPAMNAIFKDSLLRFSNVCNGCFKTIYTLSMKRAQELGIRLIVTGLSRGQMFETRLTEEMFRNGRCSPEEVDAAVLAARKTYHRLPDEVSRSLDVGVFETDDIFDEIQFLDFYRYVDVKMEEMYSYLREKAPWVRPEDTGRSTNCLINDVGIYIHKKERGFHNYALPYSWDVRLGHKNREAALEELDDDINVEYVREVLATLSYDEQRLTATANQKALHAFYLASKDLPEVELRAFLGEYLPPQLIPISFKRVDAIPLTPNGKVDTTALARLAQDRLLATPYRPPRGPVATYLAELWQTELGVDMVGADDSFFELGGTSLSAMEVMIRLCQEFAVELPLETLFSHPRLEDLSRFAEDRILADVSELSEAERRQILAEGESVT